jgi:hypothetical protein
MALSAVVLSVLYLRKRLVTTHLVYYANIERPEELKKKKMQTHWFHQESSRYSFGRTGRKGTRL